jgi:hypothetical protein
VGKTSHAASSATICVLNKCALPFHGNWHNPFRVVIALDDIALDVASWTVDHPEVSGGCFAFTGIDEFDGRFAGLKVSGLEQSLVDEFVERLDGVSPDMAGGWQ